MSLRETRPIVHNPRQAVLRRLADAYDELAEIEQEMVGDGYYEDAEVAHDQAARLLTAYRAEADNIKPADDHPHHTPIPGCPRCES